MTITRADGKHVHYDLIIEWAKDPTKIVQLMGPYSENWVECANPPSWSPSLMYRFKPQPIKFKYRKAHMKSERAEWGCVAHQDMERLVEASPYFVKWLGDWVEETVEV